MKRAPITLRDVLSIVSLRDRIKLAVRFCCIIGEDIGRGIGPALGVCYIYW